MGVTRTFLGWHRTGLAAALTGTPPAGASRAAVPAQVRLRDSAHGTVVPIELTGPRDVIGLDPREVRRTEPHDGAADFEPSYFPYVELLSTDLPWRFSPVGPAANALPDPADPAAAPASQQFVRPWLALIVVPADEATMTPAAPGGLPTLTCDTDQLPDVQEAWAWAHVQAALADDEEPGRVLDDPTRSVARLVCPRRLEPGTRYVACLVPTFAAGRHPLSAGDTGADPLAPAWGSDPRTELPVYFSYSFTTGQQGSFETLARRLRPRAAPAGSGGLLVTANAPGWGVAPATRPPTRMQGALRPLSGGGADDPADEPPPDRDLALALARAVSASDHGVRLLPPMYGQDYAGGTTALPAGAATGWLAQLNTDPRRRVAAGLAGWAVAVEQEELSDRAWQQLAGAGLRQTTAGDSDLAAALNTALVGRHDAAAAGIPAAMARMTRSGGPLSPTGTAVAALVARPADAAARIAVTADVASTKGTDRFTPTFDEPVYTYLRAVAPQWLLPGAETIPDDSIVVLRTNPAFTEAFLVGLNHALARELAWRRYPLEPTGTMFRRFWAAPPTAPVTALPPLADWPAASDLGAHSPNADQLVLLVRGALLRRFPTAAIYLSGTRADGTEVHLAPSLAATIGPGAAFFGFPLTPQEALHPKSDPTTPTSWSIVLQEAVDHARFGCDDAAPDGAVSQLSGWQDLDWGHPQLRDRTHVPVSGPLAGASLPLTSAPSPVPVPTATWGLNSGHLAAILQRPAFRIRIPVSLWLQPLLAPHA
jgi:hypothetical protein